MSVIAMPLIDRGRNYIANIDRDKAMINVASFGAAHIGCIMSPVISVLSSGAASPATGLLGAITFSAFATLGFDNWLQEIKPDNCMRCVNSKLTGFKRQAKLLTQAVCMGALAHFGMHGMGHKDHTAVPVIQTLKDGRQFMLRESVLCGVGTITHKTDTMWIQQY